MEHTSFSLFFMQQQDSINKFQYKIVDIVGNIINRY